MATRELHITIIVKKAWWLRPYLAVLKFCALLSGRQPDPEKLQKVVDRGLSATVE